MKRKILAGFLAFALMLPMQFMAFGTTVSAQEPTPVTETKTFPQVQKYTSNQDGYYTVTNKSRFFIVGDLSNEQLVKDVKLIAREFAGKGLGNEASLPIVYGDESLVKPGDIVVKIGKLSETTKKDSYKVEIGETIKITSQDTNGLFYGLRTVEKGLVGNNKKMRYGTIIDYPETGVRSFHLDMGRKYFTKSWVTNMIKDLSYQGFNSIQLHFSENEGYRLESSTLEAEIPGFSYPSDGHYTKQDMKEIIAVAKEYHMEVIPSLDTPGHMKYVLDQMRTKKGVDYTASSLFPSDSRSSQTFNIFTNEEAKKFVLKLMEEYAKFFSENGSKHMNIGGDEFLAQFSSMSQDQYNQLTSYFNEANALVNKYGMTARAWNDGLLFQKFNGGTKLDSSIEICYWGVPEGAATVQQFLDNGNKVINYVDAYMYYALSWWWMNNANPEGKKVYNEWHTGKMNGLPGGVSQDFSKPYPDALLGASYALWCDTPNYRTEGQISDALFMRTRAMIDKTWSPQATKVDYASFETFANAVGRVSGYNATLPEASEIIKAEDYEEPSGETSTLTAKELQAKTIPFVQKYDLASTKLIWKMDDQSRIIVEQTEENLSNDRLKEVVNLVSAEYKEKKLPTDGEISKIYGTEEDCGSTDIFVRLDKNAKISEKNNDQAYTIEIGKNGVKVVATSETGVMYALRTIQQFMTTNENSLVYGKITDWPDLKERRLHVDCGRKYFSKDWFIRQIREMSYLKMNSIQMHFAENLGFRIECETDPSIVSKEHLTKKEVKEIIAEANKYGVDVIPSLDTPGHVEHILKVHPEYGQVDVNGNHSKTAMDVTNKEAMTYFKKLYGEYADLFKGCKSFHIGTDEFMEYDRNPFKSQYQPAMDAYAKKELGDQYNWKDVIATYVNDVADLLKEKGYNPRIWNDGLYFGEDGYSGGAKQKVEIRDFVGVDYWSSVSWVSGSPKLSTYKNKGFDLYNVNCEYFYYVLRPTKPADRPQASFDYNDQDKRIFDQWTPGKFQGSGNTISDEDPQIKGSALAIWCDKPEIATEDQVTKDIEKELRAIATKSWNYKSNQVTTSNNFRNVIDQVGHVAAFGKGTQLPSVDDVQVTADLGKVVIKMVDEKGKEIKKAITKYGEIGTEYSFEAEKIYGYKVIGESTIKGTYQKDGQEIVVKYQLFTDKTELNQLIKDGLGDHHMIKETTTDYDKVIEEAKKVSEDPEAKQAAVDDVVKRLKEAQAKCVDVNDHSLYLETKYPVDTKGYIGGVEEYNAAVKEGQAKLSDPKATPEEKKEAYNKIVAARKALKLPSTIKPSVTATDNFYSTYYYKDTYNYDKMIDGKLETFTWFGQEQKVGKEVQYTFAQPLKMKKITVHQPAKVGADDLGGVDVFVKNNGDWNKVGHFGGENSLKYEVAFEEQDVKEVKFVLTANKPNWYQIAEVVFDYKLEDAKTPLDDLLAEASTLSFTKAPRALVDRLMDEEIQAKKLMQNGTQADKELEAKLRKTIDEILGKQALDYTELEKLLDKYAKTDPALMAVQSKEFKENLKKAKDFVENRTPDTQKEIDDLKKALEDGFKDKLPSDKFIFNDNGIIAEVSKDAFESEDVTFHAVPVDMPEKIKGHKGNAYDMYFMVNGQRVLPTKGVKITMPKLGLTGTLKLKHEKKDKSLEECKFVDYGDTVTFVSRDFSVYALHEDKQATSPTVTPGEKPSSTSKSSTSKTGDNVTYGIFIVMLLGSLTTAAFVLKKKKD